MDSSTVICWMSPFIILGVSGLVCRFYSIFDGKSYVIANSVDPDQDFPSGLLNEGPKDSQYGVKGSLIMIQGFIVLKRLNTNP